MKKILPIFMEAAKQNLLKHGYLAPIMMWFNKGSMIGTPELFKDFDCSSEEAKDKNILFAGFVAKKLQADCVVFVLDAAMREMNPNHTYDITESPLSYPESMRTECIIIECVHVPSGKEDILITPYKGGNGKPVEILPNPDMDKYESRISKVLLAGYNGV